MKVVNLVSWAGLRFSYQPGEEIELDETTARARINLGLAAEIPNEDQVSPQKPARRARAGVSSNGS